MNPSHVHPPVLSLAAGPNGRSTTLSLTKSRVALVITI